MLNDLNLLYSYETSTERCECCNAISFSREGKILDFMSGEEMTYCAVLSHTSRGHGLLVQISFKQEAIEIAAFQGVLSDEVGYGTTLVDAMSPADPRFRGLEADEARAHPIKNYYFKLYDFILTHDYHVRSHIYGIRSNIEGDSYEFFAATRLVANLFVKDASNGWVTGSFYSPRSVDFFKRRLARIEKKNANKRRNLIRELELTILTPDGEILEDFILKFSNEAFELYPFYEDLI